MSLAFDGIDIDLLADYIGGALAGTPDEAAVAALIDSDERWQQAYASLSGGMERVGAALASWEPEPMPADLAERLDTLLRAPLSHDGVMQTAVGEQDVVHLSVKRAEREAGDGGVAQARPRSAAARRRRWVAPIAIAAGVIGLVGFSADYLANQSSSSSDKASDAGAGSANMAAPNVAAGKASDVAQLASGLNYTAATLGQSPAKVSMSQPGAADPSAPSILSVHNTPPPELAALSARSVLLACLQAIQAENGAGEIVADTVDYARFDGSPALVVRFHAANGAWAWAAGPQCGSVSASASASPGGGADSLGKVRLR